MKNEVVVNGVVCQWEGKAGSMYVPAEIWETFRKDGKLDFNGISERLARCHQYLKAEGFIDGYIEWGTHKLIRGMKGTQ